MADIIKLLPDSIANQIAAGEVVQRPASVVKELLENAVDAGATEIKLIIKDAGKTLVQVTDNGCGMSETDARMCFERHATSKIQQAQDLFALRTMGFRGEALASIASIARVELKSRTADNPLGTEIIIEGSQIEVQQPCQCPKGTSIAVKNLFYNTPARRNFLKSENIEKSHIYNDFVRVAMANPQIGFSYYYNGILHIQTDVGNLKQRITGLFGSSYNQRLVPVEEQTDILNVSGFVLKPEFAKKKRGEQFFFVNNRFIKSSYLNHAIEQAYKELISDEMFPSFFIFLDIDPAQVDVNVHPTKTEIKFQDERFIYQIIKSAVRRSLGRFNIAPSLDFEREMAFDHIPFDKNRPITPPVIEVNPNYNPFEVSGSTSPSGKNLTLRSNPSQWEKSYPDPQRPYLETQALQQEDRLPEIEPNLGAQTIISANWDEQPEKSTGKKFMQLHNRYILTSIKSGLMIIDQQRAHERIVFERQMQMIRNQKVSSQTLLFPEQINLMESDADLLREIIEEVRSIGFDINEFGRNSFVISAIPSELAENDNLSNILETILENFKKNQADLGLDISMNLARALARSMALKHGKSLASEEMSALADALFACEMPYQTPSGKPTLSILKHDEISEKFK